VFCDGSISQGYVLAQLGTGLAAGEVRGLVPLVGVVTLMRKTLQEEDMMADRFASAYAEYSSEVPWRWIPFVW
jgi:protein-S-isoprenylcysteine O-methyltransferase Ste14